MATRIQQIEILSNSAFQNQVAGSLLAAALNVLNEAAGTPNHANRVLWAKQILQQPQGQAGFMLTSLLGNPTIQSEAGNAAGLSGTPFSDSDIDYVVASLFDQFATAAAGG